MPTLSIDIEARFAKFQDGLDKIGRDVERSVGRMSRSFGALKNVAASFIGTFAGIATIGGIKSVINDLEKLNTVSERTGIAAKDLSGLAFAASQTGTDLEVMAKSVNRLNIALSDLSTGKNKDLKGVLTQLGLPEFAKGAIDAQEALLQLADVFPRLSDADQARVALAAFGKAGQEMIPALQGGRKELEAFIKKGNDLFPVTNKMAKAADEFNDSMDGVGLAIKGTLLGVLDALLPKLTKIASGFTDARIAGLGFFDWIGGMARSKFTAEGVGSLGDKIKDLTQQIEVAEAAGKKASVSFGGIKIGAVDVQKLKSLREYFKLQQQSQALALGVGVQSNEGRVSLPGELKLRPETAKAKRGGRAAERDDSAQRLLDQQIKAFERSIDQERELAQTRNDFLQRFYDDGLISLADYTKARVAIMEESAVAQKLAIGSEITLLTASKKGKAGDDRIAIDTKINDLLEKQADLNRDAAIAGANLFLDSERDAKAATEEYKRINIELLEMQGRFEEAARARFDLDNAGRLTKLTTEAKQGATPEDREAARLAAEQVILTRNRVVAQAAFNKESEITNRIRNDYADAEERIQLAVQSGATGQTDALRQIGLLRQEEQKSLAHQIELMEKINALAKDPALTDQIKAAKTELDRLNGSLDPLRDKMEDMVTGGFSNFFDKLASGTVSAKDAFRELFKEIFLGLAKMGKEDFLKQVFGKEGSLGGVAGWLAGSDDRKIMNQDFGKRDEPARVQQMGGFGGFLNSFFNRSDPNTQAAAPISEGVASSFGAGAQAGAGAEAALALKEVATSSTATSFALKEFADDGVAGATQQMFENVAASSIEQTAGQAATGAMTGLTVGANLAAAALNSIATQKFAGSVAGAVQSSAGGYSQGGQIRGAGTGTSDSIPVLLSNKEFVIRAKPVQEPGALAFLKRFNEVGMKALALGHPVQPPSRERLSEGGQISGLGSAASDPIPALLSNKEFIVRAKPTQEPGAIAFLTRFNKMGMKAMQRFSMGGLVGAMAGTSSASLVMAGAGVTNFNFTVEARTPRETQQQIASAAYQGSMRAFRRNR